MDVEHFETSTFSFTRIPQEATWDTSWYPAALAYDGWPVVLRVVGTVEEWDVDRGEEKGQQLRLSLELVRGVDQKELIELRRKATITQGEYARKN